jgi:hypothetical protein
MSIFFLTIYSRQSPVLTEDSLALRAHVYGIEQLPGHRQLLRCDSYDSSSSEEEDDDDDGMVVLLSDEEDSIVIIDDDEDAADTQWMDADSTGSSIAAMTTDSSSWTESQYYDANYDPDIGTLPFDACGFLDQQKKITKSRLCK